MPRIRSKYTKYCIKQQRNNLYNIFESIEMAVINSNLNIGLELHLWIIKDTVKVECQLGCNMNFKYALHFSYGVCERSITSNITSWSSSCHAHCKLNILCCILTQIQNVILVWISEEFMNP